MGVPAEIFLRQYGIFLASAGKFLPVGREIPRLCDVYPLLVTGHSPCMGTRTGERGI